MDIVMPKMGESVSEGTIIKWHKKEGDSVKRDEIIFEISTDKVDTEIPSPADGILSQIKAQEGDTVDVGTVVAVIDSNGTAQKEAKKEEVKATPPEKKEEKPVAQEKPEPKKEENKPAEKPSVPTGSNGKIIEVTMPKMGESVMEGTIIKWHKKTGEAIQKDETLFEISTDKVDTEVPAPQSGTLKEILVGEQETVEVGTVVAKISTGEVKTGAPKEELKQAVEEKTKVPENEPTESTSMHDNFSKGTIERPEQEISAKQNKEEKSESTGSNFFSPLVMNIAQKEKVSFDELKNINGTGLNGRVTKNDILSYLDKRKQQPQKPKVEEQEPAKQIEKEVKAAPAPSFAPSAFQPSYSSEDIEKIPMDNIRQKIMEHMILSRDTSVHVTELVEVDMTRIHNFIQKRRDEFQKKEGVKLTYLPFIAAASVKGLKEFPLINSSIEKNTIIRKKFINLGIAVAIEPTGLIVPNIKSADEKNITGLAKSIVDIAQRARTKRLTPDDISNGTFTITNYGVFGAVFGTPIINQPEVAILGVGAVIKKPVVIEVGDSDAIAIKPMMYLTLSHDHRLVDGMLGGKFLKYIKDTLENFEENSI